MAPHTGFEPVWVDWKSTDLTRSRMGQIVGAWWWDQTTDLRLIKTLLYRWANQALIKTGSLLRCSTNWANTPIRIHSPIIIRDIPSGSILIGVCRIRTYDLRLNMLIYCCMDPLKSNVVSVQRFELWPMRPKRIMQPGNTSQRLSGSSRML